MLPPTHQLFTGLYEMRRQKFFIRFRKIYLHLDEFSDHIVDLLFEHAFCRFIFDKIFLPFALFLFLFHRHGNIWQDKKVTYSILNLVSTKMRFTIIVVVIVVLVVVVIVLVVVVLSKNFEEHRLVGHSREHVVKADLVMALFATVDFVEAFFLSLLVDEDLTAWADDHEVDVEIAPVNDLVLDFKRNS